MKNTIMFFLLSAFTMLITTSTFAQRGGNSRTPEEMATRQTEAMVKHLDLSEEQEQKVGEINLKYAKQIAEARDETSEDREAMRSKMESILENKKADLSKVLSDDQVKLLQEKEDQMRQNRRKGPKRGARQRQ